MKLPYELCRTPAGREIYDDVDEGNHGDGEFMEPLPLSIGAGTV